MKKIVLTFIAFFIMATLFSQETEKSNPKKIGLVLSGGGAKGFAHIGALKVIEEVGRHTPFQVELKGKKQLVIVKTIDIDAVKHQIQHLAFQAIKQNEKIETEVSIDLTGLGESPAERTGLIILQAIEKINIKALPADLPESLTISVESLKDEESKLAIKDIKLPKGVEFADVDQDLELVVANVYEPSALEAANAAAAGEGEDAEDVASDNGGEETAESEDTKKAGL